MACSVRLTRRCAASPVEVWLALTDRGSLARWLPAPPGPLREVEPGRVLEIDWQPPCEEPSLVRFELAPDGDGTVLVVDHSSIDERLGMRYLARWTEAIEEFTA
jgi:uncharacterized protein YndB with AHSA1/START domain